VSGGLGEVHRCGPLNRRREGFFYFILISVLLLLGRSPMVEVGTTGVEIRGESVIYVALWSMTTLCWSRCGGAYADGANG
jgi:hypothetical protein